MIIEGTDKNGEDFSYEVTEIGMLIYPGYHEEKYKDHIRIIDEDGENELEEDLAEQREYLESLKKWNISPHEIALSFMDLAHEVDHNIPIDEKKWSKGTTKKIAQYLYLLRELKKIEREIRHDVFLSILIDQKSKENLPK